MSWVFDLENRIYTIVKTKVTNKLKSKYSKINFTQDPTPDDTNSYFPTIYIHFLPSNEYGKTLDALTINAIMSTAQIEVTSSKTQGQTVARQVIWETIEQFKAFRYEVFQTPEVIPTGNDTNCCVCRVRRMVGANDTVG